MGRSLVVTNTESRSGTIERWLASSIFDADAAAAVVVVLRDVGPSHFARDQTSGDVVYEQTNETRPLHHDSAVLILYIYCAQPTLLMGCRRPVLALQTLASFIDVELEATRDGALAQSCGTIVVPTKHTHRADRDPKENCQLA